MSSYDSYEEREHKINSIECDLEDEIKKNPKLKELLSLYKDVYKQLEYAQKTINSYMPAILAFLVSYILTLKNEHSSIESFLITIIMIPLFYFIFIPASMLLCGAVEYINDKLNGKLEYIIKLEDYFQERNDTILDTYDSRIILFYFRHRTLCTLVSLYLISVILSAICWFPNFRGILLMILLLFLGTISIIGIFIR